VSLIICRDGQQQTLTAKLAVQAAVERQAWEQHMTVPEPSPETSFAAFANEFFNAPPPVPAPEVAITTRGQNLVTTTTILSPSYTGAVLETMGPQLAEFFGATGLLVRNVDANSPAAAAGLKAGDVVVRVNAAAMANVTDWARLMHDLQGKSVSVVVVRDKHEQTLTLVPDGKRRSALRPSVQLPALALLPLLQADLWFN